MISRRVLTYISHRGIWRPTVDCSKPLFSRKIVEIEHFALRLHDCSNYSLMPTPRYILKIKMAAINGKTRYISTISRKNKGL